MIDGWYAILVLACVLIYMTLRLLVDINPRVGDGCLSMCHQPTVNMWRLVARRPK